MVGRRMEVPQDKRADRFRSYGGWRFDDTRDLAALYRAEESDFPRVLEFCLRDDGKISFRHFEMMEVLIRRWCDFNPRAARTWVRSHVSGYSKSNQYLFGDGFSFTSALGRQEVLIAEEAVDDDPDWAVEVYEEVLKSHSAESGYRNEEFLELLVEANPDRGVEFLQRKMEFLGERNEVPAVGGLFRSAGACSRFRLGSSLLDRGRGTGASPVLGV